MMVHNRSHTNYRLDLSYKKSPIEWRGSSPSDAFRPNLSGSNYQLHARSKLWKSCLSQQQKIAKFFGSDEIKVKPQITHFFILPAAQAALSCIGLTSFLEAKEHARAGKGLLETYCAEFINTPHVYFDTTVDPEILKKLAGVIAKIIDNRLLIELLNHELKILSVEMYRAIGCTLLKMDRAYSIEQLLTLNLLYGDLVTPPTLKASPLGEFWEDLQRFNQPYLDNFASQGERKYLAAATRWLHALTAKIASHFVERPLVEEKEGDAKKMVVIGEKFGHEESEAAPDMIYIANADVDHSRSFPQLIHGFKAEDPQDLIKHLNPELQKDLNQLAGSIHSALDDKRHFDQQPRHILEDGIQRDQWARTAIEGIPSVGEEVTLQLNGFEMMDVVHEQVLPLSYDFDDIEELKQKSLPIATQLSRMLYVSPTIESRMTTGTSGANFDPTALPLYRISDNLYCKTAEYLQMNRTGQSIVVLAADTSSSNSSAQIDCLKILSAGWIKASKARQNRMEFVAATYDSGASSGGHHGTMVRWIYNQRYSEERTFDHALSRVTSIKASGGNSDILSWAKIMSEVKNMVQRKPRLRKAHVYLIIISDCAFNKSFRSTPLSNHEEVQHYLKHLREVDFKDGIHITLVNISGEGSTAIDALVDLKLGITNSMVQDPTEAAKRISEYVSTAIKQQRAKML